MSRSTTIQATAYHEAGHALAAIWLDLPLHQITIVPDKTANSSGHVLHHNPLQRATFNDIYEMTPKTRDRMERLAVVSLAGPLAQRRHRPSSCRHVHASADYKKAVDCAERITCGDTEGAELLLRWLDHRAKGLVEVRWPDIEKLAHALVERRTMRGKEVRELLYGPRN